MNKEELLKRTAILKEEIAKIEQELSRVEKKERWRGSNGDDFYLIGIGGDVIKVKEGNIEIDTSLHATLNYFRFPEEAERIARVQLAYRKLDWAIRQFEKEDYGQIGYAFLYRTDTKKVEWDTSKYPRNPLPFLSNQKDAEYIRVNYQSELMTFLTGGEK